MYNQIKSYFNSLAPLTEGEWLAFQAMLSPHNISKGARLVNEGETASRVYFINKGALRLYYKKDEENEVTGNFFFENSLAGSFESYITRQPSRQILEALEDCELLSLTYENQQALYETHQVFYKVFMVLLQKRFADMQKLIALYILTNPARRYEFLQKEFPEIIQRVPQKYIASFLGITPVSLSRLKARAAKKKTRK